MYLTQKCHSKMYQNGPFITQSTWDFYDIEQSKKLFCYQNNGYGLCPRQELYHNYKKRYAQEEKIMELKSPPSRPSVKRRHRHLYGKSTYDNLWRWCPIPYVLRLGYVKRPLNITKNGFLGQVINEESRTLLITSAVGKLQQTYLKRLGEVNAQFVQL